MIDACHSNSPAKLFAHQLVTGRERVTSYPRVDLGHHPVFAHLGWTWHGSRVLEQNNLHPPTTKQMATKSTVCYNRVETCMVTRLNRADGRCVKAPGDNPGGARLRARGCSPAGVGDARTVGVGALNWVSALLHIPHNKLLVQEQRTRPLRWRAAAEDQWICRGGRSQLASDAFTAHMRTGTLI